MTHNTSIPNQNFSILCLLLAEISMKFYSKDTSLRNMMCNSSIQNPKIFMNFCLLLVEIEYEIFIQMIPPWEIWHITLLFQIKIFQFCAYFWLKLVWNFIQKIPPWEIWHITLLFQIKIFEICAYFWLKLVWNFIQKIPPWEIWHITLQFQIKFSQFCAYFGWN